MPLPCRILVLMGLITAFSSSVWADNGWYIGGSLGWGNVDETFDGLVFDESNTGHRLFGGWQFNEYFAISGGYTDLGDFDRDFNFNGIPVSVSLSADGFTFAARGTLPVGDILSVNGQLGAFFWNGNAEINAVTAADPEDVNLVIGLGVAAKLSSNFSLTADFVHHDLDGAASDVFYAGFEVHLGRR